MNFSRLTALHINIIGAVIMLVVAAILFFAMIRPKNEQTKLVQADITQIEGSGGTQHDVDTQTKNLAKEKVATKQINAEWAVNSRRYMPDLNWKADLLSTYEFRGYGKGGFKDIPTTWGTWVTNWYDAQINKGVVRGSGVFFPVPPLAVTPNDISTLASITFPSSKEPWHVSVVCKNFNDAMAHLRRFNGMDKHGMPVVNNVALTGQSPDLLMSYDLAMYVIPATAPPVQDPGIGGDTGTANAGGSGGFGGGPGMPFSGGPMAGGPPTGFGGKGSAK